MCDTLDVVRRETEDTGDRVQRRARFEREVLEHLDALYTFALRLTRNRADAEDLASDAVARAFDRWEQYTLGTNARAWLFAICYHCFINGRRLAWREVAPPEDANGVPFEIAGEVDPEGRFYESLIDEQVVRAIDTLPDDYRAAVVLSDVHELRYGEIAEVMGVPEGTVKSRLFRGRRMLQEKLLRYAVEMGYIKTAASCTITARARR